jgi:Ca2+-transporting ATPase
VLLVARGPERGELEPLGLVALSDPPRASSRPSVEEARRAGVRTVMITGDHPETALAIARQTGIVAGAGTGSEGGSEGGSEAGAMLTGPELELLDDDELRRRSRTVSVYARVAPTHKLRIVEALKADGQVAAMTGDGVNDVPAIRAAHVGIAMGHGTDAAAGAADIVLSDDNYATIVRAVRLGRSIYDNLLRFVLFLLSANAGEVLVFTLAIALGMSAPLTVVQILLVNLLTDGLPAIALGVDPPDPLVMRRAPRNPAEGLLAPIGTRLALGGATVGAATFASFLAGGGGGATARTMAFTTLVFSQLMLVYAVRGDGWFFNAGRNWRLHAAVALSAAVQALVLVVGSVSGRLDLVGMSPGELAAALTLATVPFCSLEAYKLARRRSLGVQPAGLRRTTEPRSASDPDADTGAATDHREP